MKKIIKKIIEFLKYLDRCDKCNKQLRKNKNFDNIEYTKRFIAAHQRKGELK